MHIVNESRNYGSDSTRVNFSTLVPGEFFIHSKRVLVKVSNLYAITHADGQGDEHIITPVNAIRIGYIGRPEGATKLLVGIVALGKIQK
jgi:hypothetical protein